MGHHKSAAAPFTATAQGGVVEIETPDGRRLAYTVESAIETAARLLVAAAEARTQQLGEEDQAGGA
jgi:hypothetical protein